MAENGVEYATAIRNSTLQRGEYSMAYGSYYMPSLAYGTPSMTLSYTEYEEINRPVVASILPNMDIVRGAARKVVLGWETYSGLG
jgi:hypothetical protein